VTAPPPEESSLAFTGERYLPDVRGAIHYEHWHRYAAVAPLARGKRVLDAACGEGYGTSLLAASAAHATGVDVSPAAIAHASSRYARDNATFVAASVTALPLADASVDVVVSFETIEHLSAQDAMLAEFRRVLRHDGVLVISSPNRPVYNASASGANHFHVRELDRDELAAALAPHFASQAWYAQAVLAQSAIWSQAEQAGAAEFVGAGVRRAEPAPPMYFIVVAAAHGVALPALAPLSLFDDGTQALWRDYARALERERGLAWDEVDARRVGEQRMAEIVAARNELVHAQATARAQAEHIASLDVALGESRAHAQTTIERLGREHAEALAQARDAHAREAAAHADTRSRLAYRESARGWLRFPLMAMRQRLGARR
jgi:ubiquinone/menaquinone biosynthesis C-methylase UbiE